MAPGLVATPWTEAWPDVHEQVAAAVPTGRSATPDDCAQAVMSCLTNTYMTGSIVVVDGGMTLI